MSRVRDLKDRIAVVSVGNTKFGDFPETDDYGLGAPPSTGSSVASAMSAGGPRGPDCARELGFT
jgi:hypothetical protein